MSQQAETSSIKRAFRDLGRFRRGTRERAVRDLQGVVPARLPELQEAIERELREARSQRKSRTALRVLTYPFRIIPWLFRRDPDDLWAPFRVRALLWLVVVGMVAGGVKLLIATPVVMVAFGGLALAWAVLLALEWPTERRLSSALRIISDCDDRRVVGTLIKWMAARGNETDQAVIVKLKNGLPKLTPADSSRFTSEHRAALAARLEQATKAAATYDPALAVAILKGLEQIGGSDCLPVVRKLAERGAWSTGTAAISDAAVSCRKAIEERVASDGQNKTLLRSATVPDDAEKVLLRSVGGRIVTNPNELLRPADSGSTEPQ